MTDPEHSHSLGDAHGSVETARKGGKWRRIAAFFGPAYLISVGYMDPGNWATDLQGGSLYGYRLIWVLVMSNIIALLLQKSQRAPRHRARPRSRAVQPRDVSAGG